VVGMTQNGTGICINICCTVWFVVLVNCTKTSRSQSNTAGGVGEF